MFKKKILLIDDSDFFANYIKSILEEAGYTMLHVNRGEDGLRMVRLEKPDLVLLDVVMPDMDGFQVCRILREAESNNLMPIIMLTSQDNQEDRLVGLELGADDYITKPFDKRELLSRVRNTLRRIDRNRGANPLTGLPGNLEIQNEINSLLERRFEFSLIYVDLDNFKAFNDVYGFAKGDLAIKMTADILTDEIRNCGGKEDFIGHIGGDDFIVITGLKNAERVCSGVIEQFDRRIKELYSGEDVERGHICTMNRIGEQIEYSIMSISLAAITNIDSRFRDHLQLAESAAELKKKVKTLTGSGYIMN